MAWRALRREWRSGELAVLWLSLVVAIAALTGVGFLVDRIGRAVQAQASEVLAADARVESPEALAPQLQQQARQLRLQTARLATMLSVVFNGDASQLAEIRAASAAYPLRGVLKTAAQPFGAGSVTHGIPPPGECWPDSRLAAALGAQVGGTLGVGALQLRVGRILISRPDQGSAFVEFAPALVLNDADLAATRLVQPASRLQYALLLAGDARALRDFHDWFEPRARPGERFASVADASPQIGDAARRAGQFLSLAGLVAVLLCAVAVAMSARSYVARHLDSVALLKTLGASRRFALGVHVLQLLLLAVAAALLGAVLGWLTQAWLLRALAGLLRTDLPPAGWLPVLMGLVVAVAMLAGFALPSLLQLTRVPALRVLRRDADPPPLRLWLALLPAALAILGVIYATLGQWTLSLWFAAGFTVAVAALALCGWLLVHLAGRARRGAGLALRHGLANLARRRGGSVAQIVAFGLGVLLLLVLAILRRDLLQDWRTSLPAGAPNYFFVNIPTDARDDFRAALLAAGARPERFLPMVRGRLLAINGVAIDKWPQRSRMADREQNLTWSAGLGDDNRITAGRWWQRQDAGKPLVSLASEFQESLGLKLGDRLDFDIAGERFEVSVASFRKVRWDSFRPNFFIMFPPGLLEGAAGSYMTSAAYEPRSAGALTGLVRRFPSVSIFNVGDLLAQVRSVIDKAVTAVQSVFAFTLLAGLTVLLAAVQASRDERRYETAILRVLGAGRSLLMRSALAEFAALGLLAGLLAASGAALGGWLLARQLELHYRSSLVYWLLGLLGTMLVVAVSGAVATRPALNQPPRTILN
ncbi:MAG: ABC transporter permease [Gammaproteobacteria bacterium]|nr:ABC transporter permease [Gammaproteobacteria bacterium]